MSDVMAIFKLAALVVSLGLDTLMMSVSLGMGKTSGKWRLALGFACAEALMSLVGLGAGQGAGRLLGRFAAWLGGLALLAVAAWLIFFEDEDEADEKLGHPLAGWALIVTALGISLDELAVGFSIGLTGVPVVLTIVVIALQAFVLTLVGLTFGSRLRPYLGEWAEKLAGVVLALLGVSVLLGM